MAQYMTEQRRKLVNFLKSSPDRRFSARELAGRFEGEGISLSAVYRNLTFLEGAGMVTRSVKDGSREIFYQYIDNAVCKNCIHLTCTRCGRTFHMSHALAEELLSSVALTDGFKIDRTKTVLYGLCSDCA